MAILVNYFNSLLVMCQKSYQPNDRLFRFFLHLVESKELESNLEMHGLAFHESHVPFLSFFTNISTCPFVWYFRGFGTENNIS